MFRFGVFGNEFKTIPAFLFLDRWEKLISSYLENEWPLATPEDFQLQSYAAITDADKRALICKIMQRDIASYRLRTPETLGSVQAALTKQMESKFKARYDSLKMEEENLLAAAKRLNLNPAELAKACEHNRYDSLKMAMENVLVGAAHYDVSLAKLNFNLAELDTAEEKAAEKRFTSVSGMGRFSKYCHQLSGSTYVPPPSDHKHHVKSGASENTILDATHSEYILDETTGRVDGFVVAISDGCGHGDAQFNQTTAEIARFLTRRGSELMKNFVTPEELEKAIPNIIQQLENETLIRFNLGQQQKRATITIGRAFNIVDGYQFVGFSIGDTMLLGLDTENNQIRTLVAARKDNTRQTDGIPDYDKQNKPIIFNMPLPKTMAVLPVTDGAYDCFPCKTNKHDDIHTDVTVDEQQLSKIFSTIDSKTASAQTYVTRLQEAILTATKEQITQKRKGSELKEKTNAAIAELRTKEKTMEQRLQESDPETQELKAKRAQEKDQVKSNELTSKINDRKLKLVSTDLSALRKERATLQESLNHLGSGVGDDTTIGFMQIPHKGFVESKHTPTPWLNDLRQQLCTQIRMIYPEGNALSKDHSRNLTAERLLAIKANTVEEWVTVLRAEYATLSTGGTASAVRGVLSHCHDIKSSAENNNEHLLAAKTLLKFVNKIETSRSYKNAVAKNSARKEMYQACIQAMGHVAHLLIHQQIDGAGVEKIISTLIVKNRALQENKSVFVDDFLNSVLNNYKNLQETYRL